MSADISTGVLIMCFILADSFHEMGFDGVGLVLQDAERLLVADEIKVIRHFSKACEGDEFAVSVYYDGRLDCGAVGFGQALYDMTSRQVHCMRFGVVVAAITVGQIKIARAGFFERINVLSVGEKLGVGA